MSRGPSERRVRIGVLLYILGFYLVGAWQASRLCLSDYQYPEEIELDISASATFWPFVLPFILLNEIRDQINPSLRSCP